MKRHFWGKLGENFRGLFHLVIVRLNKKLRLPYAGQGSQGGDPAYKPYFAIHFQGEGWQIRWSEEKS